MEFSRIGEHTIKCVISEEEIYDLGYTMDEIMSNGERTQEFMNQIFDMASEEFGTDFNSGIKTVRADFLADHTLSLTFSEHPATEGMMEHLKDIVNGLLKPDLLKCPKRCEYGKCRNTPADTADLLLIHVIKQGIRLHKVLFRDNCCTAAGLKRQINVPDCRYIIKR